MLHKQLKPHAGYLFHHVALVVEQYMKHANLHIPPFRGDGQKYPSTKFYPRFTIDEDFVFISNELDDVEIDNIISGHLREGKYVYSIDNDFDLVFEYDEFKSFIKTKLFKLTFNFHVKKTVAKCGFYTYYDIQ
ncbi:hypothetical protein [Clostridium akagii]|uniref:hypothetical protein n=1 Tax=Clostridium akagii TaxID=91623 RepID=UPI000478B059|nr:hypothetical protein [Clostridium akagii]